MTASVAAQQVGGRLRALRTGVGLSVRTLATRAGFSPSFISQIELGHASPSIDSLERIARALGVTLSDFFAQAPSPHPAVVNAEERQTLSSAWSKASIEALSPVGRGHQIEAVMVSFEPGGRSGRDLHAHPGDEFALVFEGEVILTLGEVAYALQRGDAVTIPAGTPHSWRTAELQQRASVVMVAGRFDPTTLTIEELA